MDYDLLLETIKAKNLTINKLAKEIGVSRTGLQQTLDRHSLSVKALIEISFALVVDPRIFIQKESIHPGAKDLPEVENFKLKYLEVMEENRELQKQLKGV